MYELKQLTDRSYYINCPAKIGIYRANETDVYLIDSGNDKEAGKKVRKILDAQGWQLKGIINTHSNADHTGGNRYLQQQTGCSIFASGIETAFIAHTVLEPAFLYGGYPMRDLRHKFLQAEESEVKDITSPDFPDMLEVIPLPGHFFDMIGIRTPDRVVFLADCICSKTTLEKYRVTFLYDVDAYKKTLDFVEEMAQAHDGTIFVPAHADAFSADEIIELTQENRRTVDEIAAWIKEALQTPKSFETLLKEVFDAFGLRMTMEQYVLVGSTVRSYLSWLRDINVIDICIEDNRVLWRSL